jgi:hypothetical protein
LSLLDVLWVIEAVVAGCLLVCRFTDLPAVRPRWARLSLIFGAGAAGGIGLSSCLFFLFGVLLHTRQAAMSLELAILAWAGYEVVRRRIPVFAPGEGGSRPLIVPVTAAVLIVMLAIATGAMSVAWETNPQGAWDAWAIWNLRARFLASDAALAQRAWSPALGAMTHAEYPLLLSGFIGRCWAYDYSYSAAAPIVTGYAFFLALIALAAGGVALLRGSLLGLLTALALTATPALLHEVPNQYSDVPLACYYAGALLFALLDRPVIAGIFAGFAAWTKDEGLLFLLLFLVAMAVYRRGVVRAAAGALPAAALVLVFKMALAKGTSSLLSTSAPEAIHRLGEIGRYAQVATAFAEGFRGMAVGWYHPVLPLIALAAALRFDRERRRDAAFCGTVTTFVLLGYFGIYLITSNDLSWQLQSSLNRLLVQVWPCFVLTAVAALHAPKAIAVEPASGKKLQKKQRR